MTKNLINLGKLANDGTGDTLRVAFSKCNDNFDEVYNTFDTLKLSDLADTANTYVGNTMVGIDSNASQIVYRRFTSNVLDFSINDSVVEVELKKNIIGDHNFLGNISVDRTFTSNSQLIANNTTSNTLTVVSDARVNGTLTSNQLTSNNITSNILTVTSDARINGNLFLNTLVSNTINTLTLTVNYDARIIGNLGVDGTTRANVLLVTANARVNDNLTIDSTTTTNFLIVNNDARVTGKLFADSMALNNLTVNNSANIGKDLTVEGNLTVNGNTIVNDTVVNQTSVYSTDTLFVNNTTSAVSTTTGAIKTSGGIGVAGDVVAGGIVTDYYKYQNGDSLLWNEFPTGNASPGPTAMHQRSISGFNAYNSSDFPGSYYTGVSINGSTIGAQIAINWNGEEGVPLAMYIRSNDDTSATASWGSWQKVLLSDTDIVVKNITADNVTTKKIDLKGIANQVVYRDTNNNPAGSNNLTFDGTHLSVGGAIKPSSGNTADSGIKFPSDPGGGSGDTAWIRYYAYTGENTNLEIGISNDGFTDSINFVTGGVGINRQTPTATLDVNGSILASGDITAYSDASIKTNVQTISNPLSIIDNIRGVYFDRIDDGAPGAGVIAQEIQPHMPMLIKDNDGILSVNYNGFSGLFIESIKALKNQVEELQAEIIKLKSER